MPTLDRRPAATRAAAPPSAARAADAPSRPQPAPDRGRRIGLIAAVAVGTVVTALVVTTPSLRYGPQRPVLHAQIATAAALVALLVALLAVGRYRRAALAADLLLALSFGVLGVSNLLTSAIQAITGESPHGPIGWMPVSGRLVAAALLAAAALCDVGRRSSLATTAGRNRTFARPRRAARMLALASVGALALLALVLTALDPQLPAALGPGTLPSDAAFGPLAGSPASIVLKGSCLVLVVVAAIGFAVRGRHAHDRLSAPLSWGVVLLAFAWLNYLLVPSLYVNWFYAGDVLALAAYLLLAIGAVAEIGDYQRDRARLAALEERGRVARELHDGVAQEVLYMLAQARRLQAHQPGPDADRLLAAAERALSESRSAISALRAPSDESLPDALERIAGELAHRLELDVRVDADPDVEAAPDVRDALARIVGEALANAARHGVARRATVELRAGPPRRLLVRDDGRGFDPDPALVPDGSFGLQSMRERAAAVGGHVEIRSAPGAGTEVEVTLP